MARVISKTQVSDPGPSWPSCFVFLSFKSFEDRFPTMFFLLLKKKTCHQLITLREMAIENIVDTEKNAV